VISVLLIEVAVLASARLSRVSETFEKPIETEDTHKPLGGGIFAGWFTPSVRHICSASRCSC
jgi:hypothetical protein